MNNGLFPVDLLDENNNPAPLPAFDAEREEREAYVRCVPDLWNESKGVLYPAHGFVRNGLRIVVYLPPYRFKYKSS
jgi:hypothetical protein